MKSMAHQIQAMHQHWPNFDVLADAPDRTLWFGWLAGIERRYRLLVEYGYPKQRASDPMWRRVPVVRVLSPHLTLRFDLPEGPIPHVFFDDPDITLSALCLFDPAKREWSRNNLIAHTTIPWAADWLACYECWLATGEWFGGGRHIDQPPPGTSQ
jgi:hypothetical protein